MSLSIEEVKKLKSLTAQAGSLEKTLIDILNSDDAESGKYSSFKSMAMVYNDIADEARWVIPDDRVYQMNIEQMGS
ncbi:MAG: hypothetical protein PHE99_05225 [Bacteroidales bacterium]|nr:hypothetical protein [Bacteroidales bacterium]